MAGWGRRITAGAVVLAAAGCAATSRSGSRPGPPRAAPARATPTTAPAPTSSAPPTTTSAPSPYDDVPPPPLVNTGTDYVAVARSFDGYLQWLYAHHPDPGLVRVLVIPGTRDYALFTAQLAKYRDQGLRVTDVQYAPLDVRVISGLAHVATIRVEEHTHVRKFHDPTRAWDYPVRGPIYLMMITRNDCEFIQSIAPGPCSSEWRIASLENFD